MNRPFCTTAGLLSSLLLIAATLGNPFSALAQGSDTEAEVVLTEYSDYQCPACAYFHPIVKKLKEEMGDRIEINYRFFPLNNHQYGALSARAAQAAKNQGKYLEMHSLLFEGQRRWSASPNPQPIFFSYAEELGLDMAQFREDLNSAETQRTVMEEKKEGIDRGVNATPTFFINGEKIEQNPSTYEAFRALVESRIEN